MSTNISSLEIVATGKSAATETIIKSKRDELLLSTLRTKKLMNECWYRKITIDDSNSIEVEHVNGSIFHLYYNTHDDTDDDTDNEQPQSQQLQSRKRPLRKQQQRKRKKVQHDDDYNDNDYNDDVVMIPLLESEKQKAKGKKIEKYEEEETDEEETEEEETDEEETDEEETEEEKDDIEMIEEEKGIKIRKKNRPLSDFAEKMGRNLNVLLNNINKLPTPPPTNDINKVNSRDYRSALTKHLAEIESIDEFSYQTEIFVDVGYKKRSRKASLSFILNEEKEKAEEVVEVDNDQKMVDVHDVEDICNYQITIKPEDILINRDVVAQLNNPKSLLTLSEEEFKEQKGITCTIIANIIIRIYDMSLKDQITNEIIRRRRFCYLLLFLTYYEKLEIFCSIYKERGKGSTIKNQAIKMIVKSSKPSSEDTAKIKHETITKLLNKAKRIKRLLNIANDNYNIFDAFPDLKPEFFSELTVINYERWLKLVETGDLISIDEGSQLYKNFKASAKKERKLNLDKIFNS